MSEPADAAEHEPTGSLRSNAISSARWIAIGRVVTQAVSFLTLIALARLLTPAEVGAAALPMAVGALASALVSGSFGSPLIQAERLGDRQIEVAALMSVVSGVALTATCFAISLALDAVVPEKTADLVGLASPSFLLGSLAVVPQALRSRRMAFRSLIGIEVAGAVLGSLTAVVLAATGASSESLVLGGLATMAVTVVLSYFGAGARRPRWHRAEAGAILGFGVPASLSALFNTAVRNVDYALLSARLPAADVGLYWRAYTLAVDYQAKFSQIIVRILFPLLSRAGSDQFERVRGRVIRLNTVVLYPFLALLGATAPLLIPLLLGPGWEGAIAPTQILAVGGAAAAIGTGIGPVMMAAGRPRALLVNNIVAFAALAAIVYVCSAYGLIATCVGVAAYQFAAVTLSQYALATRLLGIPLRKTMLTDPGPAAVSAVALLAAAVPAVALLDDAGAPAAVTVAVASAVGAAVYVAVLRALFPAAWADLEVVARGLLRRGDPAPAPGALPD